MENLAKKAKVEADGADHPVNNVNDGDFSIRWNAKNDDVDTWIQFKWETAQKINRVHVTEFRSRYDRVQRFSQNGGRTGDDTHRRQRVLKPAGEPKISSQSSGSCAYFQDC